MSSEFFSDAPTIDARVTYLAPGSFINRRFVAPRARSNTGEYLTYPVKIRDARPRAAISRSQPRLPVIRASKGVATSRQVRSGDEVPAGSGRPRSGGGPAPSASPTMSWMVRTSGPLHAPPGADRIPAQGRGQPPAAEAHCDSSPDRVDAMRARLYEQRLPTHRLTGVSSTELLACVLAATPGHPLALCDGNSVGDAEGVPNTLFVVDRIPERERCSGRCPTSKRAWPRPSSTQPESPLVVFLEHDARRGVAGGVP
jgi:hypothetical protein